MSRALGFGAVAAVLLASSVDASSLTVALKCVNSPNCDARGVIVLESATNQTVVRRMTLNAASVTIAEQPRSEWDLSVEAAGFWAAPQRVVFPAKGVASQYALKVWRTGTIEGSVKVPDPQPATPVAVRLVIASRPEPRLPPDIPRGTSFDCTTDKTGQWKCVVPAAVLDVAVRVEGYAPAHRWDVKVPVGGAANLGAIKLHKGATLVAWLDSGFAGRTQVPVRAVLRYEAAPGASATAARIALPVAEGVFTKKGVVQLAPIGAGRYMLEVQAKGYASARVPVQLYEGRTTTPRRSIELSPALTVRLLLQPPLGPGGIPWRVELWRAGDSGSQDAGSGVASSDGVYEAGDQTEGPLHVYLKDPKGNILASRDLTIARGIDEYTVRVDVNAVSGTVKLGDSPLPSAKLLFGGSGGAEKIRATADKDGRFTVSLPRRGRWIVDVDAPTEDVAATTEVTVEKDAVNIVLPSTEISGWVRDADGNRLSAARVMLFSAGRPMVRTSEADGTFRFRGIRGGAIRLRASDPRTRDYSRDVELTLRDNGSLERVELNLERIRQLEGVVRSNGEPVVGAFVHGYAFMEGVTQQRQATTDLQGRFSLDVPTSVSEVSLIVGAPGRTLESFSLPARQESVTLDLASRGGTLKLHWKSGALPLQFAFNDRFMASNDVFVWARGQGARIDDGSGEIPNVAPGKYRFCSADQCAEGFLAIGGELELDTTRGR